MDDYVTARRKEKGFLEIPKMITTVGQSNLVLDPYSVLISAGVEVGSDNTFYPNVVIERSGDAVITIGNGNVFYPGTYIVGSAGNIRIGNGNEFGPNGCAIMANVPDASVAIGDNGRYNSGASIMGRTELGTGSQVLGSITVQSCKLAGGETFKDPDPDSRAAVLKGFGLARGITLEIGQVVNGSGNFAEAPVEMQRDYHPKPTAK